MKTAYSCGRLLPGTGGLLMVLRAASLAQGPHAFLVSTVFVEG